MNPRRLYRSRDRQLAGVAGGMAEYLDIDPTVIRILWIIVAIASGGLVLLAYFILALVIPQAPYATAAGAVGWAAAGAPSGWSATPGASTGLTPPAAPMWDPDPAVNPAAPAPRQREEGRGIGAGAIVGAVLIVAGTIALADNVLPGWVGGALLGPAVILALGAALLVSSIRRSAGGAPDVAAIPVADASAAQAVTVAAAQPWDFTGTQSVDPLVTGRGPGTATEPSDEEGANPA